MERHDEIQLIDIVRIFSRQKRLIIFITLIFTLGAVAASFLLPKVYEVSTIVEPGSVVDSPEYVLETIVGGSFNEEIQELFNIPEEKFPEIRGTIPKGTSLVKISIQSTDPVKAVAILSELTNRVTPVVQDKIDREISLTKNKIKAAEIDYQKSIDKIALLKAQIAVAEQTINALENDRKKALAAPETDAMAVLLYSNEIQNQLIYLNKLQIDLREFESEPKVAALKIENLKQELSKITAPTIHKKPVVPRDPVKPRKVLLVFLGLMLGVCTAMFLALFRDYLSRNLSRNHPES